MVKRRKEKGERRKEKIRKKILRSRQIVISFLMWRASCYVQNDNWGDGSIY